MITTGKSCNNVAVPLTAVLYGSAGTVVQVVRRSRVETRRVEVGLMSGGNVEIRDGIGDGDIVVARAGALLREGDRCGRWARARRGSRGAVALSFETHRAACHRARIRATRWRCSSG